MAFENPFISFNFVVQLEIENPAALGLSNPLCNSGFAECDGLEMSMEPKTVREGGNNTEQIHLAGPVSYGTLTLKRGMTLNLDLWKWFAAATIGPHRGTKARGIVLLRDASGTRTHLRFTLEGCLPVKLKVPAFNAKDGQLAVEELQIAYSRFRVEAGG
jgi:phage tail-like protein